MGSLTVGIKRTQQQLADEIASKLSSFWDGAIGFQNGGTEPTSNIGPWLKNGNEWRFFDAGTGRYSLGVYFPGMIIGYGGATMDPSRGWLLCDGTAYSRSLYADLFAVIGSTYGSGDGSSTFNVPDRRGRAGIGAGAGPGLTNRVLGTKLGEETHLLITAETPLHRHKVWGVNNASTGTTNTGLVRADAALTGAIGNPNAFIDDNTVDKYIEGVGGDLPHNNMQPVSVENFIIKT